MNFDKDKITISNGDLHTYFETSGDYKHYSIIPVCDIRSIELDDRSKPSNSDLVITTTTSKKIVLERFQNDVLAKQALSIVLKKIKFFNISNQAKRLFKWSILWIYIPVMAFLTILVLNYAISIAIINITPANNISANKVTALPVPKDTNLSKPQTIDIKQLQKLPISSNQLASLLKEGVDSGKFTVNLSPIHLSGSPVRPHLYVFSDPLCAHCKKLEFQLKKLTNDLQIYVFPVSIIGKDKSASSIAKVLCSSFSSKTWEMAMDGETIPNNTCEAGYLALEANNKIFRTMGFLGTPTIISSTGNLYPLNKPFTADEILNWAKNN